MRIQATQINPIIGDIEGNTAKVLQGLERARKNRADVVLFPEMTLLGYPPEDLLLDARLKEAAFQKLSVIAPATHGLFVVVGLVRKSKLAEKPLHNSAAVFIDGELTGFQDKILLPTYDVFDERRFFAPGEKSTVFSYKGLRIGITICEDAWQHGGKVEFSDYPRDPIAELAKQGIDLLLNLSASPYHRNRSLVPSHKNFQGNLRPDFSAQQSAESDGNLHQVVELEREAGLEKMGQIPENFCGRVLDRIHIFSKCAKTLRCPVVMCNQVGANDEIVFDGHSFAVSAGGELVSIAKGFAEEDICVDLPLQQTGVRFVIDEVQDLFSALTLGVRDYFHKLGFTHAILGLSGGVDSAVTACIAVAALGKEKVTALNMPSRYSSESGIQDAEALAQNLGIAMHTLSIDELFQHYLDTLAPFFQGTEENITEENLQSRIRGMLLMAFSNKFGSIVLATGDKSEMAMGFTTLYGDMVGGLGVLQDVTKTNVYRLAHFVNRGHEIIPSSILSKPPSPELKEGQTALDHIPPYDVLDPILEDYLEERLSAKEIAAKRAHPQKFVDAIISKVHAAEYKRRQAPIGIRVTQKAFSRGRVVPIVQKWIENPKNDI